MPKKQLTNEEKILQNINERFVRLNRENTDITDNQRGAELRYGLFEQDTNLGYYRENGATAKIEIEEFNKLQFEEKYRGDLIDKYKNYQEAFNAFHEEYKNYQKLQSLKVELDNAKIFQEQLIENAKKNNETLELDPISTDVEGLESAKNNFHKYYKQVVDMSNEIRNLEKEETFNKMLDEHMAKIKENEPKEKVDPLEEERIKKEEEQAKVLEEQKRKEEELKKAEEDKIKEHDYDEKNINSLEYYAASDDIEDSQEQTIDKYFNEYVGKEKLESTEKFSIYGFDHDVTLGEALDAYKKDKIERLNKSLAYQQDQIKEVDNERAKDGFDKSLNVVNDCVEDGLSIREREGKFDDVLSYYSKEIRFDSSDRNKVEKVSQIVGIANRLAQIHSTTPKPGFFSRLFNTKYNKLYNAEKGTIEFYKDILTGSCKLDKDYVDKITDSATCNEGINQNEFMDKFYEGMKSYSPNNILFKSNDINQKISDNIAKIQMVKAAFNGKEPIEMVGEYFKANDEYDKMQKENAEKINANYVDLNEEELDDSRVRIEIKECAPEKQGFELDEQVEDNEMILSENGPEMSSN